MKVVNINTIEPQQLELVMYVGRNPYRYGFKKAQALPILANFYTHKLTDIHNPKLIYVETRGEAIQKYCEWLRLQVEVHNPTVLRAFSQIKEYHLLGCHCAPLPCHADVILKVWQELNGLS